MLIPMWKAGRRRPSRIVGGGRLPKGICHLTDTFPSLLSAFVLPVAVSGVCCRCPDRGANRGRAAQVVRGYKIPIRVGVARGRRGGFGRECPRVGQWSRRAGGGRYVGVGQRQLCVSQRRYGRVGGLGRRTGRGGFRCYLGEPRYLSLRPSPIRPPIHTDYTLLRTRVTPINELTTIERHRLDCLT